MPKQILNAVPEVLYETVIPVYTYHFVVVSPNDPYKPRQPGKDPVGPGPGPPPKPVPTPKGPRPK